MGRDGSRLGFYGISMYERGEELDTYGPGIPSTRSEIFEDAGVSGNEAMKLYETCINL